MFDEHLKLIEIDDGKIYNVLTKAIYFSIHRYTSFIFYVQAALAGVEIGYFNAGYLCKEYYNENSLDCIEQFFNMYLMVHGNNTKIDAYAALAVAEYYQWKKRNFTEAMQLYVKLYESGDPQVRNLIYRIDKNID